MRRSSLVGSLLAVVAVVAVSGVPAGAYEVVAVSNGGTIAGRVVFREAQPRMKKIIPTKNSEVCGGIREEPEIVLGPDGGVQDAVVYLKEVKAGKGWNDASKRAVLDNHECRYLPRIQAVATGATLEVVNSDPILHNVHGFVGVGTIFNNALWKDKRAEKVLESPGLVRIDCDVHGWMRAWVYVGANPYYAMTAKDGSFTIADVPPGSYTLVTWHEYTGAAEIPVTVKAKDTVSLTAELKKQGAAPDTVQALPQVPLGG